MTPKGRSDAAPEMSFEEAFRRLEETAQALEEGNLALDEAARLYEEGMNVAKLCNRLLSATEVRITRLKNAYLEETGDAFLNDDGLDDEDGLA